MTLPGTLLAKIKASLANAAHKWSVVSYVIKYTPGTSTIETLTVSFRSQALKIAVNSVVPLQIAYIARYSSGTFADAQLFLNGMAFETTDAALNTQVKALADAHATAQTAALEASITLGPQ